MILFDFVMNQRLKRTIDTFPFSREALHVSSKSATRFADICRTFFGSAPRIIFWITPRSVYKEQKGAPACNSTILDIVVSATRTLASVSSPQSVGINSRNTASICLKKQKEERIQINSPNPKYQIKGIFRSIQTYYYYSLTSIYLTRILYVFIWCW